jgi:hypothetical protein
VISGDSTIVCIALYFAAMISVPAFWLRLRRAG